MKWVASTVLGTGLVIIAEENVRRFAEKKHWDEFLSEGVQSMPDLSFLYEARWFWFAFGLSLGLAAALWIIKESADGRDAKPGSSNDAYPAEAWSSPLAQINPITKEERIFTSRSANEIMSAWEKGLLPIEVYHLMEPYIGRWLKTRGTIDYFNAEGSNLIGYIYTGEPTITGYTEFIAMRKEGYIRLDCKFSKDEVPRLMGFAKNDHVTVVGRISADIKWQALVLEDCEISL